MINKVIYIIFNTDSLPILGGATATVTQTKKILDGIPSIETIINTVIIAIIGATIGYLVKILLDMLFHKPKSK